MNVPAKKRRQPETVGKKLKRTDMIVEAIKSMLADQGLQPGDRLPQEKDLITQFGASKGTVREALKALEVQGLISVRTGPGGGAFIERTAEGRAMSLLSNYLFSRELTIANIYELRKVLEPLVATNSAANIDDAGLRKLQSIIAIYDHEPANAQERWNQRMAELDFHSVVAEYCSNPLLSFVCRFLQRLLKDLAIAQDIYNQPEPVQRQSGIQRQLSLIAAMRRRDGTAAARIAREHMLEAEQHMLELQAKLMNNFLADTDHAVALDGGIEVTRA